MVTIAGDRAWVLSGLTDLVVLKSTGSEFTGFPRDEYTTLREDRDRILATAITARWRYADSRATPSTTGPTSYAEVRRILLESFARKHSLGLQQSLYYMGEQVLLARPEVVEIRMSMPNRHHFLVDLSPFGLDNDRRGLPRGRSTVRPDRGHRAARRRARRRAGLAERAGVLLMSSLVIDGCAIATVDAAGTEYASGHVVITDGRIAAVGAGPAPAVPDARRSTVRAACSRRAW